MLYVFISLYTLAPRDTVTVVVVEISKSWFPPLLRVACGCAASDPLCDGTTGQCVCPTGVTGRSCDHCENFTFGYDPVNGCTVSYVHCAVNMYVPVQVVDYYLPALTPYVKDILRRVLRSVDNNPLLVLH